MPKGDTFDMCFGPRFTYVYESTLVLSAAEIMQACGKFVFRYLGEVAEDSDRPEPVYLIDCLPKLPKGAFCGMSSVPELIISCLEWPMYNSIYERMERKLTDCEHRHQKWEEEYDLLEASIEDARVVRDPKTGQAVVDKGGVVSRDLTDSEENALDALLSREPPTNPGFKLTLDEHYGDEGRMSTIGSRFLVVDTSVNALYKICDDKAWINFVVSVYSTHCRCAYIVGWFPIGPASYGPEGNVIVSFKQTGHSYIWTITGPASDGFVGSNNIVLPPALLKGQSTVVVQGEFAYVVSFQQEVMTKWRFGCVRMTVEKSRIKAQKRSKLVEPVVLSEEKDVDMDIPVIPEAKTGPLFETFLGVGGQSHANWSDVMNYLVRLPDMLHPTSTKRVKIPLVVKEMALSYSMISPNVTEIVRACRIVAQQVSSKEYPGYDKRDILLAIPTLLVAEYHKVMASYTSISTSFSRRLIEYSHLTRLDLLNYSKVGFGFHLVVFSVFLFLAALLWSPYILIFWVLSAVALEIILWKVGVPTKVGAILFGLVALVKPVSAEFIAPSTLVASWWFWYIAVWFACIAGFVIMCCKINDHSLNTLLQYFETTGRVISVEGGWLLAALRRGSMSQAAVSPKIAISRFLQRCWTQIMTLLNLNTVRRLPSLAFQVVWFCPILVLVFSSFFRYHLIVWHLIICPVPIMLKQVFVGVWFLLSRGHLIAITFWLTFVGLIIYSLRRFLPPGLAILLSVGPIGVYVLLMLTYVFRDPLVYLGLTVLPLYLLFLMSPGTYISWGYDLADDVLYLSNVIDWRTVELFGQRLGTQLLSKMINCFLMTWRWITWTALLVLGGLNGWVMLSLALYSLSTLFLWLCGVNGSSTSSIAFLERWMGRATHPRAQ